MANLQSAISVAAFNAYNLSGAYWQGWGATTIYSHGWFGNRPSEGIRYASAFGITTGSFAGTSQSLVFSLYAVREYATNVTARISITTNDPASLGSVYTGTTLGTDPGRIATVDYAFSNLSDSAQQYTVTIPTSDIQPNSLYYVVISPYPSTSSNYAKAFAPSYASGLVNYSASASSISANDGTIGSPLRITITNDGMSHQLSYSFNGGSWVTIGTTTNSYYDWTPPASLASLIPEEESGSCQIRCVTTAGTTQLASPITLYVPASYKPQFVGTQVSIYNQNPTVAGWHLTSFLQGYSKMHVVLTINARYSEIVSYEISYGSIVHSVEVSTDSVDVDWYSDILQEVGSLPFKITATDARGRKTETAEVRYSTIGYSTPSIRNADMYRCLSDGTRDDSNGTYLYAIGTKVYTAVGSNTCSMYFEYKERNASTYTSVSLSDNTGIVVGNGNIDVLKTYNMRIRVQDLLSTYYYDGIVSTQSVAFNLRPTVDSGAAFGGYAQEDKIVELLNDWKLRVPSSDHILVYDGSTVKTLRQLINQGGGGGGGTTDYEQLDNKPSINGHTLTGNQTSADLGISGASPSTITPKMDGTAAKGTDTGFARGDHVHPKDTSKENTSNKVNAITASSTDTQYPSALAVWTLVNSLSGSLFVARRGITTYAEITAAMTANKIVICYDNNHMYRCTMRSSSTGPWVFTAEYWNTNSAVIYGLQVTSADVWTYKEQTLVLNSHIETALSSSSSDAHVPSAKCVYDLIGDVEAALEALL